ncbi:MAG: hypothetical protein SFV23_15120 [Planctomycetaceae bacterium]|nr:hypothetical protein [Planctomycetaceae bacterium]
MQAATNPEHLDDIANKTLDSSYTMSIFYLPFRVAWCKPMSTLVTIVLWTVGLLVIWTVLALELKLTEYLYRPDRPLLGDFLENGQAKPDYAAKFHDRWLNLRSAGDELKQAGADLPFSTGGDFLLAEIGNRTENDLVKVLGDLGKEVEVKVAGISVQDFAKSLDSLTRPPSQIIEGRVNRYGTETTLTITLRQQRNVDQTWSFAKTVESDSEHQAALEEMIDEAICHVADYLKKCDRHAVCKGSEPVDTTSELSSKAQASLLKGRRSLNRYIRDNRHPDLVAAQRHFRSVVESSPSYADGYMMLSYTLAENRQEREAVEMYDRVVRLLTEAKQTEDRRLSDARFLKACSRLRCYRWNDAVAAIQELRQLADDLDCRTRSGKPSESEKLKAWWADRYLLARCHAEIGHCFGHLIVFLPKDSPLRDFHRTALPELLGQDVFKKLSLPAQDKDHFPDRGKVAAALYAQMNVYRKKSSDVDPIYEATWKAELHSRLAEVAGYAQYRFAQWLGADSDEKFRKQCNEAIRSLQESELRKPRHYSLLQNIGMILLTRRYDPNGEALSESEEYYQRSIALRPGDYYGHEQLARISLRRMLAATNQSERDEAAKAGEERVAKSLKLRPESSGANFLSFYFRLAKVSLQPDPPPPNVLNALLADINRYEPDARDSSYLWMRLGCYSLLLGTAPNETEFEKLKNDLVARLQQYALDFKDEGASNWRTRQMLASTQQLELQLAKPTFAMREIVRLDMTAAIE